MLFPGAVTKISLFPSACGEKNASRRRQNRSGRGAATVDCVIGEVKEPSVEFNKPIRGPGGFSQRKRRSGIDWSTDQLIVGR
jgi:hypothetical protein